MTAPSPPPAAGCVAPGCSRPSRRGLLCGTHYDKLGQTLADLKDALAAGSGPALVAWRTGSVSGGALASQREPVNLRLLSAQAEAPVVLDAWAAWVRTGRRIEPPTRELVVRLRPERDPGPLCGAYEKLTAPCAHESCRAAVVIITVPRGLDAAADRKLLSDQLDWIVGHPEVETFWCQLRALWSDLRGHRPVRLCTCGGPVWSEPGGGWCSWCARPWSGLDLVHLPRPVEPAA